MTHQEKLAFIRAKCIEANPEIMELKFGCVIQMTGTKQPDYIKTPVPITSVKPMSDGCWEVPWGCFHPVSNKKEYIVIGRPIRLWDVIEVVRKAGYSSTDEWYKTLGHLVDYWGINRDKGDDLDVKSEGTINYIYDVLK